MTSSVQLVLGALLDVPGGEVYGIQVVQATGMAPGQVYPLLARLEKAGWITGRIEQIDPRELARPARRYYRLTAEGAEHAREELARIAERRAALGALITQAPARRNDGR
jgi:DNA-binding PadR family transcriptional regulator